MYGLSAGLNDFKTIREITERRVDVLNDNQRIQVIEPVKSVEELGKITQILRGGEGRKEQPK